MSEQEIDQMDAGREMDCLIVEHVLDWHRIQAPKIDYDGPLPEQGEVLVNPWMLPQIESGEYKWPPKGIIPLEYFVTARYSTDIAAAWHVCEKVKLFSIGRRLDGSYTAWGWNGTHVNGQGETAPLAICRLALKAAVRAAAREKRT